MKSATSVEVGFEIPISPGTTPLYPGPAWSPALPPGCVGWVEFGYVSTSVERHVNIEVGRTNVIQQSVVTVVYTSDLPSGSGFFEVPGGCFLSISTNVDLVVSGVGYFTIVKGAVRCVRCSTPNLPRATACLVCAPAFEARFRTT